jgi:hypothetical protein
MNVSEFDPTRPIRAWRKAWRNLTKQAGLLGLRFHDLRHHAITELAESGASEQTIMAIAGHVSRRMPEHYSHIRMEAKRNALEALSNRLPGGYGTMDDPVPVYTDLGSMNGMDRQTKKLEVSTVPEDESNDVGTRIFIGPSVRAHHANADLALLRSSPNNRLCNTQDRTHTLLHTPGGHPYPSRTA